MKKNLPIIIGLLCVSMLSLSSCHKDIVRFSNGEEIRFSVGSESADTKAGYSGDAASEKERIDWQEGDLLRIYCDQASEPSGKYADYKVTSVDEPSSGSPISTAYITSNEGAGLCWGTGDHTFYGVFPSPEASGVTKSISGKTVTASIPAVQGFIGDISQDGNGNWVAEPDLNNMLMTAKATANPETGIEDGSVFMSFTPLTTAIEFTITNKTGSRLDLTQVQLISGNGKTTAEKVICGDFSVDIDKAGISTGTEVKPYTGNDFKITYSKDYPLCSSTSSTSTDQAVDRTISIIVGTEAEPLSIAVDSTFTFTFFLNPVNDFDDLTFKFIKSDASWMSTRLGYVDGDGIFFPRHKKSFVTGLLVPEGAQWTVKYDPTVQSWDTDNSDINPTPETEGDPSVISWDTDIDDELTLTDPYNGHEYVEIGGIKWATCNIGATSPKDCGWYFSWTGTTGYVRDGSKWVTAQGGSELSGGFSWANTTYNTGGVDTSWNKYIPTGKTGYWTGGGSPDNILFLESDDDAAHVNWGGSWRMPTKAEFQKLYKACGGTGDSCAPAKLSSPTPGQGIYWVEADQTYISDYAGVAGLLFCDGISKLFFVAAGYGVDGNFNDEGFSGRYWSGSVCLNPPCNAYYMAFISNKVKPDDANGRKQGFPVRPVSD